MHKKIRPWLRFIEGAEGGQADAGTDTGANDAGSAADAGKGGGGDTGDRGSKEKSSEPPAEKPATKTDPDPAPDPKDKTSEPAPNDGGKAGDSSEVAQLKAELAAMKESLGQITQDREKEAREKRDNLATDVAKRFGLPSSSAHRLRGDTQEEIEADAKALARDLGYQLQDPTQGQGSGGSKSPKSLDDAVAANIAAAGLK